eukprot:2862075-Prymnesium_polylepis.1
MQLLAARPIAVAAAAAVAPEVVERRRWWWWHGAAAAGGASGPVPRQEGRPRLVVWQPARLAGREPLENRNVKFEP